MAITASGTVSGSTSMTLTDSDTNSTSTISLSNSLAAVTRPSSGPPASPASTDLVQMYADKIFKKTYTGISASSATSVSLSSFPDLFCNTGTISKVNAVTVKNLTANPIKFVWDDLTGATGDIIKVPAYGYVQIGAPMDGVTVAATTFSLQCATSGSTSDAIVTVAYQR